MLRFFVSSLCLQLIFLTPAVAERIEFNTTQSVALGDKQIPTNITVRMEDVETTRLLTTVFLDLSNFQASLPDMVDGPIYDDCDFGVSLDLQGVDATDTGAAIAGQVTLRLNSCPGEDSSAIRHSRLSAKVDFAAGVTAAISNNCLTAGLENLELDGRGLIGNLADLIGIVDKASEVILAEAARAAAENPICPDFPESLDVLEPSFDTGGIEKLPSGALGASMGGSIEVTATSLLSIFVLLDERGAFDNVGKKSDCACEEAQ